MSGYLSFKQFITPTFIMVIYLLGALAVTIVSFIIMIGGFNVTGQGVSLGGAFGIVMGILMLIFGNLAWRLLCEYWVVQFRIYEEIASLNRRMGGPSPQPAASPPPPNPATPNCPSCGGPLRYIQQYKRWYCDKEQKYA